MITPIAQIYSRLNPIMNWVGEIRGIFKSVSICDSDSYRIFIKMMNQLKFREITERIIGASFEVHKFLGNGFQEVIYQRALAWEMSNAGLDFNREIEQEIFYKNLPEPIGTRRADFVVENKVLVELKAITELTDVHKAQILNYLKAYRLEVGLLINFGSQSLIFKRFVL